MTRHTALLELPEVLRAAGVDVVAMEGWESAQGHYLWTDPHTGAQAYDRPPSCFQVHHTGGHSARPMVQDPTTGRWSVANAWLGLDRGTGRLYASGEGVPRLYLTAAGPARVSAGYGYRPAAWDHTFQDIRAPWKAGGPDGNEALNRYAFALETVHPGDGSRLDNRVWDAIVTLGAVLEDMFGWSERTIGHASWTRRKIDPNWAVGLEHDGTRCIIDIQDAIAAREGGTMVYQQYVKGMVEAWAEDGAKTELEFHRLKAEGLLQGDVSHWVGLLQDPSSPEWLGFFGRTTLSAWHRPPTG